MRLEAVTECEHGIVGEHDKYPNAERGPYIPCPGGSRRVASTTDLIEELIARGAEVVEPMRDEYQQVSLPFSGPTNGRYLVFSLEGEKP